MLNKIWFWLLCIGILYGFGKAAIHTWHENGAGGQEQRAGEQPAEKEDRRGFREMGVDLNQAALEAATSAVEICLGLIGVMALWLGILRIARDAGVVDALARALSPLMRWLFPEVPAGHPALGAMLMNLAANMLGLDNAATPLGLKAMQELQTLNPVKDTATNSMAMFLAMNTSSVTLIPFVIIGYRVTKGSANPAGPLAAMLVATTVSTTVAIIAARTLQNWPRFSTSPNDSPPATRHEQG